MQGFHQRRPMLFTAQQAHITAQLSRQLAHIGVYKALGGGWVDPR